MRRTPWRRGPLEPGGARERQSPPVRRTPSRGGPLEAGGARERQSPLVRRTPWRGGSLEPGRLNDRPPHPNGVVYRYSTSLIQLPSTFDMGTSVPIAMPGYYRRRTSRTFVVMVSITTSLQNISLIHCTYPLQCTAPRGVQRLSSTSSTANRASAATCTYEANNVNSITVI